MIPAIDAVGSPRHDYDMSGRRVVVVAFDGVQMLDVVGPIEVFSVANRLDADPVGIERRSERRAGRLVEGPGEYLHSDGIELDSRIAHAARDEPFGPPLLVVDEQDHEDGVVLLEVEAAQGFENRCRGGIQAESLCQERLRGGRSLAVHEKAGTDSQRFSECQRAMNTRVRSTPSVATAVAVVVAAAAVRAVAVSAADVAQSGHIGGLQSSCL